MEKSVEIENVFEVLNPIDVSKYVEKKNGLSYISWAFAWSNIVARYPDANYEIIKNENNLPYFIDETGAMVYTTVTINGITREMWLPVMDGANNPLKKERYTYEVANWEYNPATRKKEKNGTIEKIVEPLNMFDVNKTIMRCLVKNLAMFGFGINVYAGEDLPLEVNNDANSPSPKNQSCSPEEMNEFRELVEKAGVTEAQVKKKYGEYIFTSPQKTVLSNAINELRTYVDSLNSNKKDK